MVRPFVRHAFAVVALLALAACGKDSVGSILHVDITPHQPSYAAGATARFTVRNLGEGPVPYSLCTWQLQRSTAAGWVTAESGALPCAMVLTQLGPGESTQGVVQLPGDLQAGTYRVYYPGIMQTLDGPDPISVDLVTRKSSRPFEVTD